MSADKFRYTGLSGDIAIEGVDDRKDMEETRWTFTLLGRKCDINRLCFGMAFSLLTSIFSTAGLKDDFQFAVYKVLAAILHLGNVEIRESGGDKSFVAVSLDWFSSLLFCRRLALV